MTGSRGPAPVVHAFRKGAWHDSLDVAPLPGTPERRLALVPEIVAHADRRWWEYARAEPTPFGDRRARVRAALELFARGTVTVGGLGPQSAGAFRAALWESAGLPGPLVDRWCALLSDGAARRPRPAPDEAIALVALPGNTFTCLDAVLEQAERSAAVWVRPSRREPLSAARLVAALLAVDWPPERIGLYPTQQRALHGLMKLTDRHVVYGGAGLAASMRGAPSLTLHGPGRGCALVPPGLPVDDAVAWLLPLVAADSGRFCSNVRTVVCVDADPEPVAKALATALDALHPGPAPDPASRDWPLTAFRVPGEAERAAASVHARLRPGDRLLTREPSVVRSADGALCVRPQLALLDGGSTASGASGASGAVPVLASARRASARRASACRARGALPLRRRRRRPGRHRPRARGRLPLRPPATGRLIRPAPTRTPRRRPMTTTARDRHAPQVTFATLHDTLRGRVPELAVDLDAWTRRMMRWHFSPETGSPFWVGRLPRLGFDPIADVDCFAALDAFGLFDKAELRAASALDLRPRGYRDRPFRVFETGGTTGAPCRIVNVTRLAYDVEIYRTVLEARGVAGGDVLAMTPSGPHAYGHFVEGLADSWRGAVFAIDFDPRWVKASLRAGGEADAYTSHLVEQTLTLLTAERPALLFTTSRLLLELAMRLPRPLHSYGIRAVCTGGTTCSAAEAAFLRQEHLEGVQWISTRTATRWRATPCRPTRCRARPRCPRAPATPTICRRPSPP
ncbi:hypothetical protein RB200_01310 [Streptomyces sp. PmtG]